MHILRSSLFRAAFILFAASLFNRLVGFVYRAMLVRVIGDEGIGLLQRAVPVYWLFLTLATLGLSTGVARMVAERVAHKDLHSAENVRRVAMRIAVPSVLVWSAILLFSAQALADHILGDPRVGLPLTLFPVALVASGFTSVYRGFFQGLEEMTPIALGQVVEQVTRVGLLALLVAYYLPPQSNVTLTATLAAGMMAVGEVAGCVLMWAAFLRQSRRWHGPVEPLPLTGSGVTRRLLRLSWPIATAHMVGSLNMALDAVLIPWRLTLGGLDTAAATAAFGRLEGEALPIVYLPTVAIHPLASALVPEIAHADSLKELAALRWRVGQALAFTLLLSTAMSLGLIAFPAQIGLLVYGHPDLAPLFVTLAAAAPFIYLAHIGSAVLNGLGQTARMMRSTLIASAVRILLLYWLSAQPQLGVRGAALALGAASFVQAALIWRDIWQMTQDQA